MSPFPTKDIEMVQDPAQDLQTMEPEHKNQRSSRVKALCFGLALVGAVVASCLVAGGNKAGAFQAAANLNANTAHASSRRTMSVGVSGLKRSGSEESSN